MQIVPCFVYGVILFLTMVSAKCFDRNLLNLTEGGGTIGSRKKRKHRLQKELNAYARAGMKLWLNGKPSTPSDIMHQCMIREEGEYMRDFVSDDSDRIIGIGFDCIKK